MTLPRLIRITLSSATLIGMVAVSGCGREAPTRPFADGAAPQAEQLFPAPEAGFDSLVPAPGKSRKKLPPEIFHDEIPIPPVDLADPLHTEHLLVELIPGAPPGLLLVAGMYIVEEYPEINMVKLGSERGAAATQVARILARKAEVLMVEPDHLLRTPESLGMPISFNDGEFDDGDRETQPFLEKLRVPEAQAVARGSGIRVAVIDTGVDPVHPSLAGKILAGRDLVDSDDTPWEIANGIDEDGDGVADEAYGHGTHVAGLIGLLAPDADIVVYRVLDGDGWGTASNVAKAILCAVKDGARIINLSLGMYEPFRAVEKAVEYAADRGVVVITAAGNDGVSSPVHYPAYYPLAVGVGSCDPLDRLSVFSNFGPHIMVTAPGEGLLSSYPGGHFASGSGTSMSTAVVSALAALILERNPEIAPDVDGTSDMIFRIGQSVVPDTGLPGLTGLGRVDFLRAVR